MIQTMYAIRDSAAETFHPPFCARAAGQATRDFAAQVNRPDQNNPLYQHPADFELYRVGTYDDSTGRINAEEPQMIMRGKDASTSENF